MGGWNEDSKNFSTVTASPTLRKQLAVEILEFIEEWKFDGFDIDWEYPALRNTTHPNEDKVKKNFMYIWFQVQFEQPNRNLI